MEPVVSGQVDRDFFISRAGADSDVALVITKILRDAGYTTFLQDEDFGPTKFMARMRQGFGMVDRGARLLALLSRPYMASKHCLDEAEYPLTDDPANEKQRLIVLRVEECKPTGFLKAIPYVDLVPLMADAEGFAKAVIGAVDPESHPREANFADLYRRSAKQILHPEVRAVAGFTAREAELAAIEEALWRKGGRAAVTYTGGTPTSDAATAALKGLGGVGKSVLAQQYAWVNRERYQGVWWVRAEQKEVLLDDLIELGVRLIDASIGEIPERRKAGQLVLDEIAQRQWEKPWLMVYDNVESPDAVADLTPGQGAQTLITTRWSDWHGHAAEVPIDVFPRETAVAFLMERARGANERPEETETEAGLLADDVGCLPLALAVARAQAWRMNWNYAQYREHLGEMLKRAPARTLDYPRSVHATLTLALDKVLEVTPEAEKLLAITAFLAPERIPLDLFPEDIIGEIELGEAVAALADVSLVTHETLDDGSSGFSVHRLVQRVMRERLGDDAEDAVALATSQVAKTFPNGEIGPDNVLSWPACRKLEAHVVAVLETAPERGKSAKDTALLLNQYALFLKARARYADAEPHYRRALMIDEANFGPDHPFVATRVNNLAMLLLETNRLAEVEPLIRRALKIVEMSDGPNHPNVSKILGNLALLMRDTNRLVDTEPILHRALKVAETSCGPDHPLVADSLNNLAGMLHDTGRPAEAEPLYRRALCVAEASHGSNAPEVALILSNLGELLRKTNRLSEAEPLIRRALRIKVASYGPDHPEVARSLNNLALILEKSSRFAEAESLHRRALKINEASFGPDHPTVATSLNNLAGLLRDTNRYAVAEPLFRRALKIDEASFGPDHPNVAVCLNNLAGLLRRTNRRKEAEPLFRRSVGILEASYGPDHPHTKRAKRNLADLEAEMRDKAPKGPGEGPAPRE
jgi:tetratricopeptide (TPR) repeat protein